LLRKLQVHEPVERAWSRVVAFERRRDLIISALCVLLYRRFSDWQTPQLFLFADHNLLASALR
jgi:hypothetical protein